GRPPFDGKALLAKSFAEMRRTIAEVEPPRPSTRLSTLQGAELENLAQARGSDGPKLLGLLRGDLDWIVMKCLEKDRTRRYETANDLALDLERSLFDQPVTARPPSALYRLRKFVGRHKTMLV